MSAVDLAVVENSEKNVAISGSRRQLVVNGQAQLRANRKRILDESSSATQSVLINKSQTAHSASPQHTAFYWDALDWHTRAFSSCLSHYKNLYS